MKKLIRDIWSEIKYTIPLILAFAGRWYSLMFIGGLIFAPIDVKENEFDCKNFYRYEVLIPLVPISCFFKKELE